jgi:hypothetical protein
MGQGGLSEDYNKEAWSQEAGTTGFAPFEQDTDYFGSGGSSG